MNYNLDTIDYIILSLTAFIFASGIAVAFN
jgi:hypothetical protein